MNASGFGSISAALLMGMAVSAMAQNPPEKPTFKEYLEKSALSREAMDRFLRGPSWGQFDPELGYILGNYLPTDGIAKSATISTVQTNGARTSFMYAGRKSRINTYGNSFTQGQQVSDGETWQEYLAGHLGEPVRNFGVGGYGVYQTYRRMVREEKTDRSADHLIFYIWGDDHIRSLLRCRHASIYQWWNHQGGTMFQGNFWSNLEMDLETGRFVEKENLLPTTKSLYHMTEPKWMADHLQDDLALQLLAFKEGRCRDLDQARTNKLAANLDFQFDWSNPATLRSQAGQLLDRYSLRATRFILDKARTFAAQNKKKLLVVLFDPNRSMADLKANRPRYDQEIADYLTREKFDYFDMNEVHIRDFRKYNLSFEDYKKQYLMGHYNPAGNHFFAYSIKDKVLELLDPKPITYQKRDPQTIDFKDYLQSPVPKPAPKPAPAGGKGMGPLRVHPTNPRYFTDGTKNPDGSVRAVYLTGSHTWNNLVDMGRDDPPKAFDFEAYLDFLVRHDHNFIRMWAWDSTTWDLKSSQSWTDQKDVFKTSPQPWQRTGPGKALDGKPKFDLEKFDPAYFERLRARVKAAGDRGIYVSVMLFEGWALRFDPTSWGGHPFRMANNVQGINGDPNGDGKGLEIQTLTIPKITALQEAYVRKVIDTINDLDNVLYEVSNEANLLNSSTSTKDWQYHIIRFIKNEEAKKPRQHPVGMTSQGGGGGDDCEIQVRKFWSLTPRHPRAPRAHPRGVAAIRRHRRPSPQQEVPPRRDRQRETQWSVGLRRGCRGDPFTRRSPRNLLKESSVWASTSKCFVWPRCSPGRRVSPEPGK